MLNMPNLIREWKKAGYALCSSTSISGYANTSHRLESETGPNFPGRHSMVRGVGISDCTSCNTSVLVSQYKSKSQSLLCPQCCSLAVLCTRSSMSPRSISLFESPRQVGSSLSKVSLPSKPCGLQNQEFAPGASHRKSP